MLRVRFFVLACSVTLLVAGFVCVESRAAGSTNVALSSEGCTAIADSVYAGDAAAKAIDGKWIGPGDFSGSNRWHAALGKPHPHWVWLRFRQPARISRVVIHRADILDYPVDLVGEYSPDGGFTFRKLFTISNNRMTDPGFTIEREFSAVTTDNFRLRILRSSHAQYPNNCQLSEIEVFGDYAEPRPVEALATVPHAWPAILEPLAMHGMTITERPGEVEYRSDWLRVVLSRTEPHMIALCWDSLGKGKVDENLLKPGTAGDPHGASARLVSTPVFPDSARLFGSAGVTVDGNVVRYDTILPGGIPAHWEVRVSEKSFRIVACAPIERKTVARGPVAFEFAFDVSKTPVAPLANPKSGVSAPLPCLIHASDYGTLLLQSSTKDARLDGVSIRPVAQWNALIASGVAPRPSDGLVVLGPGVTRLEVTASVESIQPMPGPAKADSRLAGLPRWWLNTFQYRPDVGILANNIVSDNCVFCIYQYADSAVYTPALPGGIEAINMIRESVDRYLHGAPGYGVGWEDIETETYPSLLIAAWDVVRVTGDKTLLRAWLPHLERIAEAMAKQDRNGNGLPESTRTGVSGEARCPTSNWWDQINFGHEDAYACALAYRALGCLADLEQLTGNKTRSAEYARQAGRIRSGYVPAFLNPETGVIAGWRDSEGKLHDYCFTFVNGIAIAYGLVPDALANKIVDRIEAKMRMVGYTRFDLGLPGPLVVIPKSDYGPGALGSPSKDDGSDAWQVFENGGATACFTTHYLQALYKLGRRAEADRIFWPMIETYAKGGFQNGVGHGGEWTRWDGTPSGYEGFLADAYCAQTVLYTGYYGIELTPNGFRLAPWSPLKGKHAPLGLKYLGRVVSRIE